MTRAHKIAIAVAVVVSLIASTVQADVDGGVPVADANTSLKGLVHFQSEVSAISKAGSVFTLPPGYYMDLDTYGLLNKNTKTIQDQVTSLQAQNASLKLAVSGWTAGYVSVIGSFVLGSVLSIYLYRKL